MFYGYSAMIAIQPKQWLNIEFRVDAVELLSAHRSWNEAIVCRSIIRFVAITYKFVICTTS